MASLARVHRKRLDRVLMVQGLVPSREAAARMVLAGGGLVDGTMGGKPAEVGALDARVEVGEPAVFVRRSGDKFAAARDALQIVPRGAKWLGVGCLTRG